MILNQVQHDSGFPLDASFDGSGWHFGSVDCLTKIGEPIPRSRSKSFDRISSMNICSEIPVIRTQERKILISRLASELQQDDRVKAAWLAGSIARREDDWLSDIDLYVAIADESIEDVVRNRHKFAARIAQPTLSMDQMRNAPPQGGYLLVHYPGEHGPQHVDWFWQPESLASIPDNGLLLFDDVGLTTIDGKVWEQEMHQTGSRPAIDSTNETDLLNHRIEFFWAMSLIVAKYIVRGDDETVGDMMGLIERTLDDVALVLGVEDGVSGEYAESRHAGQTIQFQMLRRLSDRAISFEQGLSDYGAKNPAEAISEVERFFDACEAVLLGS